MHISTNSKGSEINSWTKPIMYMAKLLAIAEEPISSHVLMMVLMWAGYHEFPC